MNRFVSNNLIVLSILKINSKFRNFSNFRTNRYDCIGFDLNHTLVKFELKNMMGAVFDIWRDFLCNQKNYPANFLKNPIGYHWDFLQRGIIIDVKRGNFLKVCAKGEIGAATHGTKLLTPNEVKKIYWTEKKWNLLENQSYNFWDRGSSKEISTVLDYFDIPTTLAYALMIDTIDFVEGRKRDTYNCWSDIQEGLKTMFMPEKYSATENPFINLFSLENAPNFVRKTNQEVLEWLACLKKKKVTFLLTTSNQDLTEILASYALGKNWRDYFTFVITNIKKPQFFMPENLNFCKLKKFLIESAENPAPKILYIGDNMIHDIYGAHHFGECDTVAICEEISTKFELSQSKIWSSFLQFPNNQPTLWHDIIEKHSQLCIPSVKVLAEHYFKHEFLKKIRPT